MKIKKIYQGTAPENKILDGYSTSQTDTYSCNIVNSYLEYSATEHRIGTWFGKPLYGKVLQIGSYTWTNGANSFLHNISDLDVMVDVDYTMKYTNDRWYSNWDNVDRENWTCGSTDLIINCTSSSTYFKEVYIMLKYTKTTD